MIEKLFGIFKFQETGESFLLQLKTIFNPENFFFWDTFKVFFEKISANPLASIITLAALIGLPYTLYKAKQSSTKANERLDQLMDEMQGFEFEKPLIDLQEKFKGGSFENSPVIDYDQDVLELNFDKVSPPFNNEEDDILQDLESTSFVKQITLDQDVTDDFLSSGSIDNASNPNEESLDLSALSEDFFNEKELGQPAESDNDEKEHADFFAEDLQTKDEGQVLSFIEEEDSNFREVETSQPVDAIFEPEEPVSQETASFEVDDIQTKDENPVLSLIEEESNVSEVEASQPVDSIIEEPEEPVSQDTATPEADDLQTKMEQAIQKLKSKYAPLENDENEVAKKPVPLDINKKKPSLSENVPTKKPSDDASLPPGASASPKGKQGDSLKKSHVITHLNSFKKNFENQLDTNGDKLKKKASEARQEQSAFFKTIYKPKETTHPKNNTTTDEEYQQSLESFLFLKDQEKPE